jgi:transposase
VLAVGIDWSEDFHLVALARPSEGVFELRRVTHSPAAVDALVARIGEFERDPAEVRVVLEARHGLLVERLLDAGYLVVPVNPRLIARRRGPAKKNDDAEDARIACLLALDRFEPPRPLIPHGELAGELRAIARDDERAAKDERRLLNRLRADPLAAFPAALPLAGSDLGAPSFLRLLERWPSAEALAGASRDELIAFARAAHHGRPQRFADRVAEALEREQFRARPHLARAKADTIPRTTSQLLQIGAQRRAWERRTGELLPGAPRRGRERQPREDERGQSFPGRKAYPSMPGLGDRLAARVAGEIGDHPEQFESPSPLQSYAGKAPVTRRSGKSEFVVACRHAYNRHLGDAVHQSAFCSLRQSARARELSDRQSAGGKHHHTALRALGNRWLEVRWHRLDKGALYDETIHVANRTRAQATLPVAA